MTAQPTNTVVLIMGPTASGKTDLALALAARQPCELISVDSALVYRGMDIGTAKPSPELLQQYPHALVDILDPAESYSAASFRADALELIEQALAKGRLPVLVGGTMLYYKALLSGLAQMPPACAQTRLQLEQQLATQGIEALHQELQQIDAATAERLHVNDAQRIMRALEVWRVSGQTMSQHFARQQQQQAELPFSPLAFAVAPQERSVLHQRIAQRFEIMLEQGFVAEVEQLKARGDLHAELPSMRAVGYRQVWDYLDGQYDATQMQERGVAATRQLAKRQLTWLRSWPNLHWIDSLSQNKLDQLLKKL